MTILQEILKWSKEIPDWQSDAISRLLTKQAITQHDLDDLYALLKLAHGIPDPQNRYPQPLTADQIPSPIPQTSHIELLSIKNLRNINAIAENQNLSINPKGITIIYGDNGVGKSGYSRALKRACRARDQSEPIYPNANLPTANASTAQASFDIRINGTPKEITWQDGKTAPAELSSFTIFDTRCARSYLDIENDFSYVPNGLEVFGALANICQQLKKSIEEEQQKYEIDINAFAHLRGDTEVGNLIKNLSGKTNQTQINNLATLTPGDIERHKTLETTLKESNPKDRTNILRLRARRVTAIIQNSISKLDTISPPFVSKLEELTKNLKESQAIADLAANNFSKGEYLLPGTGGETWRNLFEAARNFSLEAQPNKNFPNLGKEDACPLCQQPLAEGAERLRRFDTFIKGEADKTVRMRQRDLENAYKPFSSSIMTLNIDEVTQNEIAEYDPSLVEEIKTFETSLVTRHNAIKTAVTSLEWTGLNQPIPSPIDSLQAFVAKLNSEADNLEKASDDEARARMQKELKELDARIKLSQVKDSVLTAVTKLEHQSKLKKCLPPLKTNAISLKATELAEKVVSKDLGDALNREFKALGVGNLSVSLQSRSDRGRTLHKLILQLPQTHSPSEILSEGEQRAIAIGSFLAEIGLTGSSGGIVFDDPVSSLDHRRRERVAKRLAEEALKRQVIIFTHDIYFLSLIVENGKRVGAEVLTQSLTRGTEGFGIADPELPFEGMNASQRIRALNAKHQIIAKLHREGNDREYHKQTVDAYIHLRMAWERAVEEVLLREVILRFRKGVETQRLIEVCVDDDDYAQVNAGMSKCSNYAHDRATMVGISVPDPDELLADIGTLKEWLDQLHKRSKETSKRRKTVRQSSASKE